MERAEAIAFLGLEADASPEQVEEAYAVRSRILKRKLVEAVSVEDRERFRGILRDLVNIRDVALGPEAAEARRRSRTRRAQVLLDDDWSPGDGVPEDVSARDAAVAFFGLGYDASPGEIRDVFYARSRALKHEIAHARNEEDMHLFQNLLARLNALLHLALEPQPEPEPEPVAAAEHVPFQSDEGDVTMTDLGVFFSAGEDDPDTDSGREIWEEPGPEPALELEEEEEKERPSSERRKHDKDSPLSESYFDLPIEPPDDDKP